MVKNLITIVILFSLLGWGIYNYVVKDDRQITNNKNTMAVNSNESLEKSQSNSLKVGIEEGNIAPDFELKTIEGKTMKLSEQKGKKVFLNFWATWCPPCKAEMPDMENFYKENKNNQFEILAVNYTSQEKSKEVVANFIKDYDLSFPVLLDENASIGNKYQVFTIPTTFVIDTKGIIQKKIVGPLTTEKMNELLSNLE